MIRLLAALALLVVLCLGTASAASLTVESVPVPQVFPPAVFELPLEPADDSTDDPAPSPGAPSSEDPLLADDQVPSAQPTPPDEQPDDPAAADG